MITKMITKVITKVITLGNLITLVKSIVREGSWAIVPPTMITKVITQGDLIILGKRSVEECSRTIVPPKVITFRKVITLVIILAAARSTMTTGTSRAQYERA